MPPILMVGTNVLVIPLFWLDLGFIGFDLRKYNEFINQEGLQGTFVKHPNKSILLGYIRRLVSMGRRSLVVRDLLIGHQGSCHVTMIEWMSIILSECVWIGVVDNGIQLI